MKSPGLRGYRGVHITIPARVRVRDGTSGGVGWEWGWRIELDGKSKWAHEFEEGGRMSVGNRVQGFIAWLDLERCGVRQVVGVAGVGFIAVL